MNWRSVMLHQVKVVCQNSHTLLVIQTLWMEIGDGYINLIGQIKENIEKLMRNEMPFCRVVNIVKKTFKCFLFNSFSNIFPKAFWKYIFRINFFIKLRCEIFTRCRNSLKSVLLLISPILQSKPITHCPNPRIQKNWEWRNKKKPTQQNPGARSSATLRCPPQDVSFAPPLLA